MRVWARDRGGDTSSWVVGGDVGDSIAGPGAGGRLGEWVYPHFPALFWPGGQMAWTGESVAVARSFGIVIGAGRRGGDTVEPQPMPAAGRISFRP